MSKRANPTLVGAFVVGAVLLAVAGVLLLGGRGLFHDTHPFILYFEGDVNGLAVGSPVKFQGVEVGSVTSIRLRITPEGATTIIPVAIVLDESLIEYKSGTDFTFDADRFQQTVRQGLRARLETESLLTGQRYVALLIDPTSPARLFGFSPDASEIPTLPTTLEELFEQLRNIDLQGLVKDLSEASRAARELLASPEIQATPASVRRVLESIDAFVRKLHAQIEPLTATVTDTSLAVQQVAAELDTTLETLRPTLDSLAERTRGVEDELSMALADARALMDPDAPLVVQLQATLHEFGAAARSLRALTELVERDPSALLRGKDVPGKP